MKKKKKMHNIQKEIFILISLLILIMLVLIISLYDFMPNNISVSETISYSSDSVTTKIKQEIAYTNNGDTDEDVSFSDSIEDLEYTIKASDLEVYGQKNLYNSGNANPFDYAADDATPTANTEENTASSETTTKDTNASTKNSSTGTFFESKTSK